MQTSELMCSFRSVDSLRAVVVRRFVVVGALVVQVTPGASQLLGVLRHRERFSGNGHVVHL